MRFTQAVDGAGITYRQADHWRRSGYIQAAVEGTGYVSEISQTEARVLSRMAALVNAGMKPAAAAAIARATIGQGATSVSLPGGLRIVFDVEAGT